MHRLKNDLLMLFIAILGVISVILDSQGPKGPTTQLIDHALDFLIVLLFAGRYLVLCLRSGDAFAFLKRTIPELVFVIAMIWLFFFAKYHHFFVSANNVHDLPVKIVITFAFFAVIRMVAAILGVNRFVETLTLHPAQTIMVSFMGIITVGTVLLMQPLATADNSGLGFINALFTSTSATCVSGLIVVDTATKFSILGKTIIMCLIQAGGLGIMVLAYFTAFLVGRKLSFQERMTISYMLDEDDSRDLAKGVKAIVLMTLFIELCGAILLYVAFDRSTGTFLETSFYAVFHSVSAFCNAGFALFSKNLMQYSAFGFLNIVIAGLIILGGLSFIVLGNSFENIKTKLSRIFVNKNQSVKKLTLNTKVVLVGTAVLLLVGTLLIYKFEHKDNLLPLGLRTQYLEAFFQSVTLRTAGFNTMDISKLHSATYAMMILFMFIGGASGSTAGGVKINTIGVIWAYVRSVFRSDDDVVLVDHSIPHGLVNQAFLVVFLALAVIFSGTLILTLTEGEKFIRILFEVCSAFGTVGLSTGITEALTGFGKIVITCIMFIGRLGPLTMVAALAQKSRYRPIKYPEGRINIG